MRVGDFVQVITRPGHGCPGQESTFTGLQGVVLEDHSPMRPPHVGRVVDILWNNGDIVDMYSDDLEVINDQVA